MADGTLTADEETSLRHFRDRMADHDLPSVISGRYHHIKQSRWEDRGQKFLMRVSLV